MTWMPPKAKPAEDSPRLAHRPVVLSWSLFWGARWCCFSALGVLGLVLGCWALKVPKRGEDVEVVLAKGALHLTLETPNGKGARAVPQVILLQRAKHCLLVFMRQHLEPEEIILQATDVSLRTWTYGADIGITWSPFLFSWVAGGPATST